MRFLFYSHDGMGLGHVKRNLAIAAAVTRALPGASVLLTASAEQADQLGLGRGADILKLPGLTKVANDSYEPRRLAVSMSELHHLRSALLSAAVESFRPAVLLVDKHPLGVRGELTEALEVLRSQGGRAVLGLRDILDEAATVRTAWKTYEIPRQIVSHYHSVLIYGQADVYNPIEQYWLPALVAERSFFCGYVRHPDQEDQITDLESPLLAGRSEDQRTVLASAGGGCDGVGLIECFIDSCRDAPWLGVAVTGPHNRPEQRARLRRKAGLNQVRLLTFSPDLASYFSRADALVCMGGYNTLVEAVASGTPTICVPRVVPRLEQSIRAKAFERRGLLRTIAPGDLNGGVLRSAIETAIATPQTRPQSSLDLNGAQRAAAHLIGVAEGALRMSRSPDAAGVVAP